MPVGLGPARLKSRFSMRWCLGVRRRWWRTSLFTDLRGDGRRRNAVVTEMKIRNLQHANLIFSDHTGFGTNILGLGFWERYNVTFDFPNHLIYLQPSKQVNKADLQDLSGIHMERIEGRIVIEVLDAESQASRAGIQPKDLLLKIDGEDATAVRLHAIRLRLSSEGKTVRLTLKRGDRVIEVPLELREQCPIGLPADKVSEITAAGSEPRPR